MNKDLSKLLSDRGATWSFIEKVNEGERNERVVSLWYASGNPKPFIAVEYPDGGFDIFTLCCLDNSVLKTAEKLDKYLKGEK